MLTCACGHRMSGHLTLPGRGPVCGTCFREAMQKPSARPVVESEALARSEKGENLVSREARIRLYTTLNAMGRDIFTGQPIPKRKTSETRSEP